MHSDDEWHPHDPASTTAQFLAGVWDQIAHGKDMTKGETYTVMYPNMVDKLSTPQFLNQLLSHLDVCKDVCDHFGQTTAIVPYVKDNKISGMTIKSFRNPNAKENEFEFDYDPMWDDGTDFEALYAGIDDDDLPEDPYPQIENKIPDDDEEIIDITKKWVGKMMSDMGICPFSQSAEKAGLPVGDVYYCVERTSNVEDMYAKYWTEVIRLESHNEKEISTTLMIIPEFMIDNVELYESFTNTLTQPLTSLQVEDLLQLVFFHPQWSFRDGGARSGEGQAANYARRSPWPMINLLRTKQVRAAQKGIPTGLVYKQNEKTLSSIGVDKLETMLRLRDWGDIDSLKVDRKETDALKIAREYQETGQVRKENMSLTGDSTPAANSVDRNLVEDGNLVQVLKDALEKRLGKKGGPVAVLTGPETSATAMAGDFLIKQLEEISQKTTATVVEKAPTVIKSASVPQSDAEARRQAKIEEARRMLLEDLSGSEEPSSFGDGGMDALFGRGGLSKDRSDDETFNEGLDPNSFY